MEPGIHLRRRNGEVVVLSDDRARHVLDLLLASGTDGSTSLAAHLTAALQRLATPEIDLTRVEDDALRRVHPSL